ncbi:hypothetical protein LEP1GSC036_0190 [Leptospira weilii str. 2006001853]|uniref:Uncharacterized protein n=3 Tax=Leptospira weilii TaxID=28184 RepID=A0A828Z616_9LEPT|nr:hypothetical protein LEP1GSC036_0190 [Leptospira weilii str. 2006001853]EMJ65381.1 hypothetical protein LEP1GSC051_1540 [Leptospira sp. P2653]EMM70860.1 hypothetical protein LEP1GSC038_0058 [Leptospira weilii str. 2006001855]EMN46761.1 hypothetical protein LEP1GSC086_0962 [Leptospira weilii str. LNT 1234]EMN92423.1 hypothetical protein LEP1GSC108_0235 [Leptospira weilii str. UI 13098]
MNGSIVCISVREESNLNQDLRDKNQEFVDITPHVCNRASGHRFRLTL